MITLGTSTIGHLDLILKCAEVCNLNCSYCYYYNMGDDSWRSRPKRIKERTLAQLRGWLARGIKEMSVREVTVTLHGGEPLLLRPPELEAMCAGLREAIEGAGAYCRFTLQTNGVLISEDWLDTFERQRISVGISIDGPPKYQDRYRVDKRGNGSSGAVERGVALLQSRTSIRNGSLSVIDPELSGAEAYGYLRKLGFEWMDFLIPMDCYATVPTDERIRAIGQFLVDVSEAWFDDPQQSAVTVRILDHYLEAFQQYSDAASPALHPRLSGHVPVVVLGVHTDGSLGFREEIFNSGFNRSHAGYSIFGDELCSFVNSVAFKQLENAYSMVPLDCRPCEFLGVCGGGDPKNRFDPASNNFDYRSVYCAGLKLLFSHLIEQLTANGYPAIRLREKMAKNAAFLLEVQGGG